MEAVDEIVTVGLGNRLAADQPSSSSQFPGIVSFQLKPSAQNVVSFKDCTTVRHGLALIGSRASAGGPHVGDYIAAVRGGSNRNLMSFWSWHKEQATMTCTCPEKLGPIVTSHCGTYVVGGGDSGMCYLWEVTSGNLIRTWKAHYMSISCMAFLDDDSLLITASKDAIVRAWSLSDLLDIRHVSKIKTRMMFNDHTLAVTDLWIGTGGFGSRLMTTSLDHTLKLWLLHNSPSEERSHLVQSILLPCPANCCVSDVLEVVAFVGGNNGVIYHINLRAFDDSAGARLSHGSIEKNSIRRMTPTNRITRVLQGHSAAVTCLGLSCTGMMLVSGSLDGSCRLWDTHVGQAVKVVNIGDRMSPVMTLLVSPIPYHIANGHGTKMPNAIAKHSRSSIVPPLKPFNRYQTSTTGTGGIESERLQGAVVQFRPTQFTSILDRQTKIQNLLGFCSAVNNQRAVYQRYMKSSDCIASTHATNPSDVRAVADSARLQHVENENSRWKRINSKLYAIAVNNFLSTYSG